MRKALRRWQVVVYLAAIFCAGAVSGWVVAAKTVKETMFSPPRPDEIATFWRNRLQTELNLSPDQVRQIEGIILDSSKEVDTLRGQLLIGIRQAISNRNTRIAALLSPEQEEQFEQMEKERQDHWRRRDSKRHRDFPLRGRHNERTAPDKAESPADASANPTPQEPSPE